jgi:pimeloyl-ACP methyl ester carboxylesterase
VPNKPPVAHAAILSSVTLLTLAACSVETHDKQEWTIPAGEVTLFAEAFGSVGAPTLIVVNGGPGVSHDYVLGLKAAAGPNLRVVFYDQRGTGRSTSPAGNRWDLAAYVEDLDAVRSAIGLARPHILGHSWGGAVALAYAERFPEKVSSLTLADSIPITAASTRLTDDRIELRFKELQRDGLIPAQLPEGEDCIPRQRAIGPIYYADPRFPSAHEQVGTCSSRAFDSTTKTLETLDLRAGASRLAIPVFVVYGDHDVFQSPENIADFTQAFPKARRAVMPACGHIPWLECPQSFWPEFRSFMNNQAAPEGSTSK